MLFFFTCGIMVRLERSSCRPTVVTSRLDSIILNMIFSDILYLGNCWKYKVAPPGGGLNYPEESHGKGAFSRARPPHHAQSLAAPSEFFPHKLKKGAIFFQITNTLSAIPAPLGPLADPPCTLLSSPRRRLIRLRARMRAGARRST